MSDTGTREPNSLLLHNLTRALSAEVALDRQVTRLRSVVAQVVADWHCTCDDYMTTPKDAKCLYCQAKAALND